MLSTALTGSLYLLSCVIASTRASRLVTKKAPEYGVGFNLALDYATASILYANGTANDVAKVQGDEAYKQTMLQAIREKEMSTLQAAMAIPNQQLDAAATANFDTTAAFLPVLQFLKLETETRIDAPLTEIYITLSSPMTDPPLVSIHSACLTLDMEPTRLSIPAWQSAIRGYNITSTCPSHKTSPEPAAQSDDEEQLILVIEYTKSGFIATLAMEECGFLMEEREMRDFTLGSEGHWEDKARDLEAALMGVTRPRFETGSPLWLSSDAGGGNTRTRHDVAEIVLTGEDADDEGLIKALQNVFGEHWQVLERKQVDRASKADPMYVAARGAAMNAFEDLEWLVQDDCTNGPC